jgi:hypothetical protein
LKPFFSFPADEFWESVKSSKFPYILLPVGRMFDLGDMAALIDPAATCQWENAQAPGVQLDYRYDFDQKNGPLIRIKTIERDASFLLLDRALARIANAKGSPEP